MALNANRVETFLFGQVGEDNPEDTLVPVVDRTDRMIHQQVLVGYKWPI